MTDRSNARRWLVSIIVSFCIVAGLLLGAAVPASAHSAAVQDRGSSRSACDSDAGREYIDGVSTATYGADEMAIKVWPGPKAKGKSYDSAHHIYNIVDKMWPKLADCLAAKGVPLRQSENHTIYWQLHCHVWASRYSDAFGETFDMETYRTGDYIPGSDIEKALFYQQTLCNW